MTFRPFEDKEKVEQIKRERDELIELLGRYDIPEDERRFLIRRIEIITDKLLYKARYAKDRRF